MAQFIYNSFYEDLALARINASADTFRVMLVTSAYAADQDTHDRRNDVTNEVTGTGYTAGGATCTMTIGRNNALNRITYTFSAVNWPSSTITARAAVIYKSRGGASSADELIVYNDFGSNNTSSGTTFTVAQLVITNQNTL
jgi:hypothetical protein